MNRAMHQACTCPPNRSWSIYQSPTGLRGLERYAFSERHILPGNAIIKPIQKPDRTFPLEKLFPELRAIVYEMHFLQAKQPGTLGEFCPAHDWCPNRVYNNNIPVRMLLMVSKLVYEEAMPIFYRKPLRFSNLPNLNNFLEKIGPTQSAHLQNISFTYDGHDASKVFVRLSMCHGLRYLHIAVKKPESDEEEGDLMNLMGVDRLLSSIRGLHAVTVDLTLCPMEVASDTFVQALEVLKLPRGSNGSAHDGTCDESETTDISSVVVDTEDDHLSRFSVPLGDFSDGR
jgi:hypothetical protein